MENKNARYVALEVLDNVLNNGAYSNAEINKAIKSTHLNHKDIGLMTNIVYGVLQNKLTIEFYLQPYLKKKKLDPWVKILLIMSIYQFEYLDKVPERAVIFESVEVAKIKGNRGISGFVNAILRNYQRLGHQSLDIIQDKPDRLSVEYSVPIWFVNKLQEQLGDSKCRRILDSLNQPAHLSIRVNTKKISRAELLDSLLENGIDAQESKVSPYGITTTDSRILQIPAFKKGYYTIQDESSMLVAPALQIQKNSKVLDACAAPGGKTTHIASFLDSKVGGNVLSLDVYDHKVKLIEENAKRLGETDVVAAMKLDATEVDSLDEKFDRILVDAPCSGLGLLRRKPEMRYTRQPEDILELQSIQKNILNSVSNQLTVGGILVYSTCTIVDEENSDVVKDFLENHKDFELITVATDMDNNQDKMVKLYPDDRQTDGFFISAFRRIE